MRSSVYAAEKRLSQNKPQNLNHASAETAHNAMELKDLSSNWRKLQSTLNKRTPKPAKRKSAHDENGRKRLKTMGSSTSKQSELAPKSLALWAEDNGIPATDLVQAYGNSSNNASRPSLHEAQPSGERVNEGLSPGEAGKYIAIDCEMVGVGPDPDNDSALARVSIVNYHGHQLYDSFVLPKEPVTDYRTFVSGITPQLLESARTLNVVQADVARLLDGRILIGHSVRNDLDALLLGHPKRDIRDTSRYPGFRRYSAGT